ncbi:hypothetical protein [Streptomyces sp. NPDC058108]|uniref:hypothetical protein n=1 Tax=Streptomyces sp. NPDC058108 TaxID=3346344 RepID=UPI0036E61063
MDLLGCQRFGRQECGCGLTDVSPLRACVRATSRRKRDCRSGDSADDVNLGAADGRTMARMMIAFANKSSHDASRRIQRKHLELARQGKSSGGQAPYGWQEDGRKVDPVAAEHIRIAQKQLLAGQIRGLGHPREGTTRLPHHLVERMLTNPRLCGYRTYRGEVLLDDGHPVIGVWEPINIVPHASHRSSGRRVVSLRPSRSGGCRSGCRRSSRAADPPAWGPG